MFKLLVIVVSLIVSSDQALAREDDRIALAVVPFRNVMQRQELDWMCDGFAETITTKLNHIKRLRLVERVQISEVLKELQLGLSDLTEDGAGSVGKLVNADFLVLGSFQKLDVEASPTLKINARVVHVATGEVDPGRAASAGGPYAKVFGIQDEIATMLARNLGVEIAEDELRLLSMDETSSVVAYELYNLARYERDGQRKEDLLRRALELDPAYAKAHLKLGSFLATRAFSDQTLEAQVLNHLSRCLELDPSLVDAHYVLGDVYRHRARNPDLPKDARKEAERKALVHYRTFIEMKKDSRARYYKHKVERAQNAARKIEP